MRKFRLYTAAIVVFLILSGCNADDDQVTNVPENVPVEQDGAVTQNGTTTQNGTNTQTDATTQSDTNQTEQATIPFTNFDLDVKYDNNQEYDVDYESEQNGMEAEIKDDRANNQLKGDEAFAVLQPIFEQLTFNKETPEEEVISEVVNAFNLDGNYQEFELDVEFPDGTEKEYNVRK
nr:YusW family protein [Lysinibacillus timonensis]